MRNPKTTVISIVPGPSMSNFSGKLHGGELLKLLDQTASATGRRYSRGYVVTAHISDIDYIHPIDIGDLITLEGSIVKVGKTSMTIEVKVTSESMYTGEIKLTNRAKFIMVHMVDDKPALIRINEDG